MKAFNNYIDTSRALILILPLCFAGCGDGRINTNLTSESVPPLVGTLTTPVTPLVGLADEPSNPIVLRPTANSGASNNVVAGDVLFDRSAQKEEGVPTEYYSGRGLQANFTIPSKLRDIGEVDASAPSTGVLSSMGALAFVAAPDPAAYLNRLKTKLAILVKLRSTALKNIFMSDASTLLDNSLTFTNASISFSKGSYLIEPNAAIPVATGSSGQMLGFISKFSKGGQALVYGSDVLGWMASGSNQVQHRPLFKRAFTYTLKGNADIDLPETIRYAVLGYTATTVSTYITGQLGKLASQVTCDLAATSLTDTCKTADIFVFGGGINNDEVIYSRIINNVKTLLTLGKGIIYMSPPTWNNFGAGTNAFIVAMGAASGVDYPGNYFACPSSCVASNLTSFNDLDASSNDYKKLASVVDMLDGATPVPDVVSNAESTNAITFIHNYLGNLQQKDISIFAATANTAQYELLRLMVQWADAWRPNIVYGAGIDKTASDRTPFLRAYASDSWQQNNRKTITIPKSGAGTYTPAQAARNLVPSANYEDIDVTIAQTDGITLIGRAAIPGKLVEIQVQDAAHSTALAIQNSYLRAWSDPMKYDTTAPANVYYTNPRRPSAFAIPLKLNTTRYFISPYGGPLLLKYNGAQVGDVIKLRIKGAAEYAHIDFTKPTTNPVTDAMVETVRQRIENDSLGWMSMKLVGGELQQKTELARKAVITGNKGDLAQYLKYGFPEDIFGVNHFSNGYNNVSNTATVAALCVEFSWDCTSDNHRAPGVQHFVGWIAACGFLCSGNPVDSYTGLSVFWGTAHELGHNTVQRVHRVDFQEAHYFTGATVTKNCSADCDNNILSVTSMMAEMARTGLDTSDGGYRLPMKDLYEQRIVANRTYAAANSLTEEQQRLHMSTLLWYPPAMSSGDKIKWAVHFQLAALYGKYRRAGQPIDRWVMFEYLRMLTMGDRLVAKTWGTGDAATKAKFAMGRYSNNTILNHELIYVLSSKIIGQDLRKIFTMYGLPLSATALGSVADLGLPIAPMDFYAIPPATLWQPETGQWISLEGATPAYPE